MNNRRLKAIFWVALLALGGCDAPAQHAEKAAGTLPTVSAISASAPAARAAFRGYRRYRGTIGTLPVTVEMTVTATTSGDSISCQGSYFYERRGGPLRLFSPKPQPALAGLLLTESLFDSDDGTGRPVIAHWQARQPVGAVLTGTWTSASGRSLPFELREDYGGAIRYELLTETQDGGTCQTSPEDGSQTHTLQVVREYLHLLGPDTLRPSLRLLQCPPPVQRRAQLREELQECGCEAEKYGTGTNIEVMYNGNGLLSLLQTESEDLGGAYPSNDNVATTYDLSTGKTCDVKTWLRPDKAGAVARLLDRQLRADSIGRDFATADASAVPAVRRTLADLPDFGLNSEGLFCTLGNLGAPHVVQRLPITIPYAALRPYVRPGTPLARLLQARRL